MIRGIELLAIGKGQSFEILYEGGKYLKPNREQVDNLLDMTCYSCGGAYYTLEDDALEFCPHCGRFDRRQFDSYEELRYWAREQSWAFLGEIEQRYFAVHSGGRWEMRPARNENELKRTRRFDDVRPLVDDLLP